jgi:hypothetical protein
MAVISSFEVISLKGQKWEIESIVDNKEEALERAQESIRSKHFSAVKVLEERYDEETGKTQNFVVFNKKKALIKEKSQYTGPERRKGREWRDNPTAYRKKAMIKQKRKANFIGEFIKLVLILGGIMLGLIVVGMYYISAFG